ncbi:MAG: ribonuclease HII [Thermomicrobiales bacterium]|nr:ribonuclease HII [Thermomicrobiales bacterium]
MNDRRRSPTLDWERRAWKCGKQVVAGVDEAGRGAWAGPLVAAAVALPEDRAFRARLTRALNRHGALVRDSKQISPRQRECVADIVRALAVPHAVFVVDVATIDELGVGAANLFALREAARAIEPSPAHLLVDAFKLPGLWCSHDAIVHGDAISFSIALASIMAKTHRDTIMCNLNDELPAYGFAGHKGYGTAMHQRALSIHGVTPHHRRSFAPIARLELDAVAD